MAQLQYEDIFTAERDLSFHPSKVRQPRTLTHAQIEQYNRKGYLTPLEVLSPQELSVQRALFDDMLATVDSGDAYAVSGYFHQYGGAWDLVTHPKLVAYATDLLGEDVICWGAHYICKLPGNEKAVTWHQDGPLWPFSPTKAYTAWLALDNSDIGNGCMKVIPGSHLGGGITHVNTKNDPMDLNGYAIPETSLPAGEVVPVELQAGQCSIHSDLVVHGSLPNQSDRRRCGVAITYTPSDVRDIGVGWNEKRGAVHISGYTDAKHWAPVARPKVFGPTINCDSTM